VGLVLLTLGEIPDFPAGEACSALRSQWRLSAGYLLFCAAYFAAQKPIVWSVAHAFDF